MLWMSFAFAGPSYGDSLPLVDLRPVHRVIPEYPVYIEPLAHDVICAVELQVGVHGLPTQTTVLECPKDFRPATHDAARAWRFERPAEPSRTRIEVVFQAWRPAPPVKAAPPVVHMQHAPIAEDGVTPLEVVHRVYPAYPEQDEAEGDAHCSVLVDVGADGIPIDAVVSGCPMAFHSQVVYSVLQWRWEPPGTPVSAALTVDFEHKERRRPGFLDAPVVPIEAERPEEERPTVASGDPAVPVHRVEPDPVRRKPATCRARVHVDGVGLPDRMQVDRCRRPYQQAVREAVARWRWPATGGTYTTVVFVDVPGR
jgi:hypothetical protein